MELTVAATLIYLPVAIATVCGPCNQTLCSTPNNCLAGLVRDWCNCCYVCGKRESEQCDPGNVTSNDFTHGRCGNGLDCRNREDLLPSDPPEALCFCRQTSKICGSDGVTYDNPCQLTEERYRRRDGLVGVSYGPCRSGARIITRPHNIQKPARTNVAFFCEATGWPLPLIEWSKQDFNGFVPLPGNKTHITIQTRNDDYEASSWLQLVNVRAEDAGIYWCKARNDEGSEDASAQLTLLPYIRRR